MDGGEYIGSICGKPAEDYSIRLSLQHLKAAGLRQVHWNKEIRFEDTLQRDYQNVQNTFHTYETLLREINFNLEFPIHLGELFYTTSRVYPRV